MSLRERLGIGDVIEATSYGEDNRKRLYELYGVIDNPYPASSQTSGHPHMTTEADYNIEDRLKTFMSPLGDATQALVVEGTQGTGKTNLLEYYQKELSDIFAAEAGHYVVRYYADPEPDFSSVVRRIIQEFGVKFLISIGEALDSKGEESGNPLSKVQNPELRVAFKQLAHSKGDEREEKAEFLLEHLTGLRIYKRHTEALGVRFRLDTTEAKTMALRDLIVLSGELGVFKALYLFLDELEKQGAQSQSVIVKYLSSIRALIDALPKKMFLVLAMTPDARRRYSEMFPSLSSRLGNPISLLPVMDEEQAAKLHRFYLANARELAKSHPDSSHWRQGHSDPLTEEQAIRIYTRFKALSEQRGLRGGVLQRELLNAFHVSTEEFFYPLKELTGVFNRVQ